MRVAACHIDIQILVRFELVQHVIDGNLDISVFPVNDLERELNLIDKEIKFFFRMFCDNAFDKLAQGDRISESVEASLIQFYLEDMIFLYPLGQKIVAEQLKEQHRFATAPNPCDDLDFPVPHMAYQAIEIEVSLDHGTNLILVTYLLLLFCMIGKISEKSSG